VLYINQHLFHQKLVLKFLLILLVFLSGCRSVEEENVNKTIYDKVKKLTEIMHKVYSLEMTYEQYKLKTTDVFVNPDYLEHEKIFGYHGKEYELKDLEGISANELRNYKRNILEELELGKFNVTTTVYLSKVYDDPSHHWKIVFEKKVDNYIGPSDERFENYTTQKYVFAYREDGWKILSIEKDMFYYNEEKAANSGLSKEELLEQNLNYLQFQNKPIEYVEKITYKLK